MKVISFHLKGKMAHFRKFYSNASALSYFVPPRTTICGIIAGLLGLERDGYYDDFSLDNCKITITSCSPLKKTMQKLNYLMIKSVQDLNGSQENHSQTATELVIPQDIRSGYIDYKIWFHHCDNKIMSDVESIINDCSPFYESKWSCVALGSAFNLGWIEKGEILEAEEKFVKSKKLVSSSIPIHNIEEIKVDEINTNKVYKLIKEEVPLEFDQQRRITKEGLKEILINVNGDYIPAVVDSFVSLDNGEVITWLE
ncbi:CRISPR-associated protein Cas5 [Tepidanaerobacter acetatoxydans Re1]|uniref:CRISPR-associated protein Cas5 n=1 Tax=Tepidanaerobacter acetatoxydans (strain DSM 21804 / JCM 16047 / Re1) TaxID=1209989 RepID=F4LS57_TEPAE|nr:CRISPR-associated protein Cas5 [Tepidanaerobacter acetatoxydans]AEE90320.1 CRISPR-associated protein Cas5 [Tepidanaerobacter acetatoxydans Re1]CCP24803.1 CRISPR-associated protein Cas5 [Tepidanaerobacter acetatoxydans Re1]